MEFIKIYRSINEPIRENRSYEERNSSVKASLESAWEAGRKNRESFTKLIPFLKQGGLPKLSFKGGHNMPPYKNDEPPKYQFKHGHYNYLAQRQGILGEDLNIEVFEDEEQEMICKISTKKTIFTFDILKLKE